METGQGLTDEAVAGLAKALGRRQKRVAKQAKKAEASTSPFAPASGAAGASGNAETPLAARASTVKKPVEVATKPQRAKSARSKQTEDSPGPGSGTKNDCHVCFIAMHQMSLSLCPHDRLYGWLSLSLCLLSAYTILCEGFKEAGRPYNGLLVKDWIL